jgi:hypothetical protein
MPRVVIMHRLLAACLTRTKRKKKRKSRSSAGTAGTIEVMREVVIFPLQLCQPLSVFRGFQYQILIKYWRRSSLKTCYQSLLKVISRRSVQRSQTVGFPCSIPLGKR